MVVSWDEKIAGVKGNSKKAKAMRAYFQQQKEMDEKIKRGLTHEDHLVRMGMSTAGVSKAEATHAVTGRSSVGGRRTKRRSYKGRGGNEENKVPMWEWGWGGGGRKRRASKKSKRAGSKKSKKGGKKSRRVRK